MQIDILLKQVLSSLDSLKTHVAKFEKHESPSTQYTEQLHIAIQESHKLLSAYLVLKEQKDVSPDLDLHIKLMSVPTPEEKNIIVEPIIESITTAVSVEENTISEPIIEKQVAAPEPFVQSKSEPKATTPLVININDKFRFINELFAANASEYTLVLEQLNSIHSLQDTTSYLNELKAIYHWNEHNEMVKKLYSLAQKRFS